ncbi:hypothetical protein A2165_01195 [Candidatus Curtissbacteria bacterium RBG_13_40_7]|uniref:Uncharacterized protein n=1 Tax=Candidatus Curtissbacteria bacterium RBG_13_40_7 TaxID=1797706 RepID=A0A1F5FVY7_9BACT|nr:MAG: hypothetical protein A2165_01195 [Candidatus Curtissbacteria bacterium RBG_13_40_7]
MKDFLAQTPVNIGIPVSGGEVGLGGPNPNETTLAQILSTTIGLLTVIAAIYFMFTLIIGAIGIISSGGDKGAFEDARKKITMGAIGFVVVIAAMFIMEIVATVFGLPDILNLQEMITRIRLP